MKSEEERILVGETEEEAEINEIKSHALVDDETKYHRRWRQHRAITVDTVDTVDTV